ncbi:16S rRNA (guanine(966)-N(2))-methyltransferase RsmD [Crenobacter cavernae]|uniref:16S rRNA (Guanine(966)-N(2))-methyltransferase RsmD n=1 Tax=Crenobacter cavernae TaxID=2290923 RepID=A0ABY0FHW0_9NEIS|nr:16S rRNA (guanine(966)-N(2))-methyltransferase RsmD [Crenobacter cavernae]RXZ44610.1 16S rRNA (guanine(966)-N(2))-methyltransferase RsmD [Crenobacter cavernae]
MSATRNQVRIIAGRYRRRLLSFPDQPGLRPTPDRVRETLFNWLGQELYGWTCLDLFAGSGALGFEAASREAKRVVMVEKSRVAVASLRANRQLLGAEEIEVVEADANLYIRNSRERFDLILLDPPFDSDLLEALLPQARERLADDGLLYCEARRLPALDGWQIVREAKAGQVHCVLLQVAQLGPKE